MLLNLIIAFVMIYLANITRGIEKNNEYLVLEINKIKEDIHINKIELTFHKNNDYLNKLYQIYFSNKNKNDYLNLISINNLSERDTFFYLAKDTKSN